MLTTQTSTREAAEDTTSDVHVQRVHAALVGVADRMQERELRGATDVPNIGIHIHTHPQWQISIANPTLRPELHVSRHIAAMPEDQLVGIVAHEVGHAYDPRARRRGQLGVAARLALFTSPALPATLLIAPAALATLGTLWTTRQFAEHQADYFAHLLGFGEGLQEWLRAFADSHGEDLERPSVFGESHPSTGSRIRVLQRVAAA